MTARAKAGTSKAAAADRRRLFVRAYIANGHNATQAAIAAGYSPKGARVQGVRLLADANTRRELAAVAERSCQAADLGVDRTLRELACVAYADPRRLFGPDGRGKLLEELDADTAAALATVQLNEEGRIIGFRFWDKNAALGMAMRHHGLFEKDNRQQGASLPLRVYLVSAKPDAPREPQEMVRGSDGQWVPHDSREAAPATIGSASTYVRQPMPPARRFTD